MEPELDIKSVNVGDVFSTEQKLRTKLGCKKPSNQDERIRQNRNIERYFVYEKTGKLSRGKPTQEIIITAIKDPPDPYIDKRINNGRAGKYIDLLKPMLQRTGSFTLTIGQLMARLGIIPDPQLVASFKEKDRNRKSYKVQLKTEFRKKLLTALKSLKKGLGQASFFYQMTYLVIEEADLPPNRPWIIGMKIENFDKKESWRVAWTDEHNIIKEIIKEQKKAFEVQTGREYKSFKFDNKIFLEYLEAINGQVTESLGITRYCEVIQVEFQKPIYTPYELEKDFYSCQSALKKAYCDKMSNFIENYHYIKPKECIFKDKYWPEKTIYPLKNNPNVELLHKQIFGE